MGLYLSPVMKLDILIINNSLNSWRCFKRYYIHQMTEWTRLYSLINIDPIEAWAMDESLPR